MEGDERSDHLSISGDGRFISFQSWANNLVPGGPGAIIECYVFDRDADCNGVFDDAFQGGVRTWLISRKSDGQLATHSSRNPKLSDDGRTVVFFSMDPLSSPDLDILTDC
ncbi:MAG: hypothetical protein DWQ01_10085 [Planctomycetota bacterium]|nr:MAG: hypothetical protein DWQ01_10085 [Planctomycetota bacterium]